MSSHARDTLRAAFISATEWRDAEIEALKQDASFRRYFRLTKNPQLSGHGNSCLLMDAPAPHENIDAYLDITASLREYGLRVPQIYHEDRQSGFALIEDFGDQTFTQMLAQGAGEAELYALAIDVLVHLHTQNTSEIDVPTYRMDKLLLESDLFIDWFVPAARGYEVHQSERAEYTEAWKQVLQPVAEAQETLVLRDYHVDNLMIIDGRYDVKHCGILDYQDALLGARAYDLVSLLEDARRDVSDDTYSSMFERYIEGMAVAHVPMNVDQLRSDMIVLGAQRHAKVAGIFTRLSKRDNKHHYLAHVPRVLGLLERSLSTPVLAPVRKVIEAMVPDYSDVLIEASHT